MCFDWIQLETLQSSNLKSYLPKFGIPGVSLHLSYNFLRQSCWRTREDSLPWAAILLWAYTWPWVKNICYRADCWSRVNWLLRATNRQALPCSLRYAGGLLHLQPRSKHLSSRSNSSNKNAESSGHPHPLGLRPIISALPSMEGRARNQAYKYWAYSFVRVY